MNLCVKLQVSSPWNIDIYKANMKLLLGHYNEDINDKLLYVTSWVFNIDYGTRTWNPTTLHERNLIDVF